MQRVVFALAFASVVVALYGRAVAAERLAPRMIIIGHRGVQAEAPRNTLASLRRAIELGLDYVELDLRTTADGKIIDMHNETVDGSTNGSGLVCATTIAEMRELDAGSWFKPEFRGERVPLFAEELALAKGRIKLYLDMKDCDGTQVARLLEQFGMVEDVVCFPNRPGQAEAMLKVNPSFRIMPHLERAQDMPGLVERYHVKVVEYSSGPMKPEVLEAAHQHGAQVFMDIQGRGDNEQNILAVLQMGVDGIQTDDPRLVLEVLKRARVERPAPPAVPEPAPAKGERPDGDKVKVIGYGGNPQAAPANTLAGVRAAIALGLDYVGVPVYTTADGLLVVASRPSPDSSGGEERARREMKYDQLRALDIGSGFSPAFKGEYVPLLGEVLALAHDRIRVYLDIADADPKALVNLIDEFAMTRQVLVQAPEPTLREVRTLEARIPQVPYVSDAKEVRATARKLAPEAINMGAPALSRETVALCIAEGIDPIASILGGTADFSGAVREAIAAGAQTIWTDKPAAVLEVLR